MNIKELTISEKAPVDLDSSGKLAQFLFMHIWLGIFSQLIVQSSLLIFTETNKYH